MCVVVMLTFSCRFGASRQATSCLESGWKVKQREVSSHWGSLEGLAPQRHKQWPTEVWFDGLWVCINWVSARRTGGSFQQSMKLSYRRNWIKTRWVIFWLPLCCKVNRTVKRTILSRESNSSVLTKADNFVPDPPWEGWKASSNILSGRLLWQDSWWSPMSSIWGGYTGN